MTKDIRTAASDLALVSSRFLQYRGHDDAKRELVDAISGLRGALREGVTASSDPNILIDAYLDAGGDWRDLVAAVSRTRLRLGRES